MIIKNNTNTTLVLLKRLQIELRTEYNT